MKLKCRIGLHCYHIEKGDHLFKEFTNDTVLAHEKKCCLCGNITTWVHMMDKHKCRKKLETLKHGC